MAETKITGGLVMYRLNQGRPEIFLVHTGGPYYATKDRGAWSIPKGIIDDGEDILKAAQREFKEETGFDVPDTSFIELGSVERPGKKVYAWAFRGDCDPSRLHSNTCMVEWPPRSGKHIEIPEVDRGAFVTLEEARIKLFPYLVPIIDLFEERVMK